MIHLLGRECCVSGRNCWSLPRWWPEHPQVAVGTLVGPNLALAAASFGRGVPLRVNIGIGDIAE